MPKRTQKADKRPARTLQIKLDAQLEERLDELVGWMEEDPVLGGIQARLGREKAARYAIIRFSEAQREARG